MKKRKCPKCNSENIATERRPNGNSKCLDCQYEAPTQDFDADSVSGPINNQEKINEIAEKLKNNPEMLEKLSVALFQMSVGNEERRQDAFEFIAKLMKEIDEVQK